MELTFQKCSLGIGRAISLKLASVGTDVVILYAGNQVKAEETVSEISQLGRKSLALQVDVSDADQVNQAFQEVMKLFGKIDVLINNAGITKDNLVMRMNKEDMNRVMDVDLKGVFLCSKAVMRPMMKQRKGRIINISSVVGVAGNPSQANYAAAKAGVIGLTKTLVKELASRNITFNALAPRYIETDINFYLSWREETMKLIPLRRAGTPEDISEVVLFLASESSRYITGQTIHVDGGMIILVKMRSDIMRERVERNGKSITLIDLSDKLKNSTSEFEPSYHKIKYSAHKQAVRTTKKFLGLEKEYWPEGEGWAVEEVKLSTHSGTHIDAPYHYGSTMESGEPARTIDEVPLSWCYGDGVVLSMTHKQAGEAITIDDLQAELSRIEYKLKPFDIVLIRTDASKYFKKKGYEFQHPGLIRSSTEWLVNHGVKMIGIDAWGLDRPFNVLAKEALEGKTQFWEAHLFGREKEYLQIEKLTNLDQLPKPYGFKVSAFPVNIEKASAGWARVVAILED